MHIILDLVFSETTRCSNDILVSDNLRISGFGYANNLVVHGKIWRWHFKVSYITLIAMVKWLSWVLTLMRQRSQLILWSKLVWMEKPLSRWLYCKQNQFYWENGKLNFQRICCLCLPQKVSLHHKDIKIKRKMCVFSSAVLLHNTESPVISVEDLLKLGVATCCDSGTLLDLPSENRKGIWRHGNSVVIKQH